jgi:hypothetical protein
MNVNNSSADDSLNGVPNIGPARRAALEAAGITTRAQLAHSSAEQLVSMTGMARSFAEKTLEFVRYAAIPVAAEAAATDATGAPVAPVDREAEERILPQWTEVTPPAGDEAGAPVETAPISLAEAAAEAPAPPDLPPALEPEDGKVDTDSRTTCERQVLRAQTALSDLTRLVGDKGGKEFLREAERLSNTLEALLAPSTAAAALKPKRLRRLIAEVEATAAQVELLAEGEAKTGKKAQQRYAAILRDDRKVLEAKAGKAAEAAPPAKKKTDGGKKPGKKK